MAEERITTVESPDGTVRHTTVVQDSGGSSSGGAGWMIGIVLVLALMVGGYWLVTGGQAEMAKDNAITGAANDVGQAARQVGDAAQEAADSLPR